MPWFDERSSPSADSPFLESLRAAIERWPPPRSPPRFVVAYSGGVDSVVLLAALAKLGARVRAVHVDHGLVAESGGWADHCARTAAALGIEHLAVRVVVEGARDLGQEAAARAARYRALEGLLVPGEVLLTAHHADDQLETLLLNFLRGSGVRGMRGIVGFREFGTGYLGRPLLGFRRAELRAQAEAWDLPWIEDPSNRDPRHDRNFLRNTVLPPLLARWPAAATTAGRLAEHMAGAEALLEELAAADAVGLDDPPRRVPRAVLEALGVERGRNLLRYVLRGLDLPIPSTLKLDEILTVALTVRRDAQPHVRWPGGEARVHRNVLHLGAPLPPASPAGLAASLGVGAPWSGPEGDVRLVPAGDAPGLPQSWLGAGLSLRFRAGGERLPRAGHHLSLAHWLQAAGIVPWMRGRVPLIYRDAELVAVADLWLAPQAGRAPADEPRWRIAWERHPPVR